MQFTGFWVFPTSLLQRKIVSVSSQSSASKMSLKLTAIFLYPERTAYHETLSDQHLVQLRPHPIYIEGSDTSACKIRHLDDFQCDLQESKKKSTILHAKYSTFFGGEYRDRTGDLLHAMQALSRTVSKHTPTRKCGDGLNIALIRSIRQKSPQLHPTSRNHAPPTRQFYHPIFKCVNGFCSERRSFTRKVFSDSLLSAILILHIKVALFIFPKSIDKEVFSTMPMYFCCFLSMNQPHDP